MKPKNLLITGLVVIVFISNISTFSFAQGPWTQKTDFAGSARYHAASFSIGN